MDIRRLVLWEGRYATYMSNDIFAATIEDQGDVLVELTSRALSGARINALALISVQQERVLNRILTVRGGRISRACIRRVAVIFPSRQTEDSVQIPTGY